MFGTFPIRMKYDTCIQNRQDVDVYNFTVKSGGGTVALCWFIHDREWRVVDVKKLIPVQSKLLKE